MSILLLFNFTFLNNPQNRAESLDTACGGRTFIGALGAQDAMQIVHLAIQIYSYVVLASVILSWVQVDPNNPLVRTINNLTEPVLRPIRAVLPSFMGLDFSPIVLFLGLGLLQRLL